ncbi:cyclic nucleotide-binding domain-containing protein [Pelagibacterium sediminicola]|uniref:cyclic nucleotide-binding domain-containing protein n=1 Tax=Pelagibacterium sediminicola TaxID=2248761 RepID=UPI000E310B45|nr:cyclic nucleotide-binding domain-containing protein [Pelagibacterium sediminicola]
MAFDESGAFRALELFADFNDEQMRLLSFASEAVSLRMGEELFSAGAPANGAYVLVEGQLEVSGEGAAEGFVIEPPAVVGEMGLMLARPRAQTVVARRASELLLVPREPFLKILRSDAALAESVANTLRGQLADYLDRVTKLAPRFSG